MGKEYTSKGGRAPFDFKVDGVPFVCAGSLDVIDLSELAKVAEADVDSPEGMAALADTFKSALGPAEYARFKTHRHEHHTDNETLFDILRDMVEHMSEVPTPPPSQSVPGRPSINGSSVDVSPLPEHEFTDAEIEKMRAALAGR